MSHTGRSRIADTSVLVRYLTGTPPEQFQLAAGVVEADAPLGIPVVALLETAHVLRSEYAVPREVLVDTLTDLLRRRNVYVCELPRQRVIDALAMCRPSGRVSFGDALIWARVAEDGAQVYTFDRRFPAQDAAVQVLR